MRLDGIIGGVLVSAALTAGFLAVSTGAAHATYSACMDYALFEVQQENARTVSEICAVAAGPNPPAGFDCTFVLSAKACDLAKVRPK